MNDSEFFRFCPVCGKKIFHKSKEGLYNCLYRMKLGTNLGRCKQCVRKDQDLRQRKRDYYKTHEYPMKGHTVYEIWLKKYGKQQADRRKQEMKNKIKLNFKMKTEQEKRIHREKSKRVGKQNGMYGKSVYEVWIEKYGKEEADKKLADFKQKVSKKIKERNKNIIYRKAPAIGSGNGISGWYKGWFFRSLKQLTYMIDVIETNNFKWRSMEKQEFGIEYQLEGQKHIYYGDFLINDKIFIEIKPKQLMNTKKNIAKRKAAIEFCNSKGYEYRMVDVNTISYQRLIELYENKQVSFTKKYKERIQKLCRLKKLKR